MIVVTGAAGFIGSCLIGRLNRESFIDVIAVDDFASLHKVKNLANKQIYGLVHRDEFSEWLAKHHRSVQHVFHLGARTDTVEQNQTIFDRLNLNYSKTIWELCSQHAIPLTYASSAATYGDGSLGYEDDHDLVPQLQPLNPYGRSKNDFDHWVLGQSQAPPFWTGLKFFNVYGPNEYHKARMASVIYHTCLQIERTGEMVLFRSHRSDIADGHQSRDFIYVQDVLSICLFCMQRRPENGIYNAGTGKARTFLDLVHATFDAMNLKPVIKFMDTPEDIRSTYQYFTEANMAKLSRANFDHHFYSLEDGVKSYVQEYLVERNYY